jgi:hypothetical protein
MPLFTAHCWLLLIYSVVVTLYFTEINNLLLCLGLVGWSLVLTCKIATAYLAVFNFKLIISPVSHIIQKLLHIICMEIHLRRHTLWVCEWWIVINSSKNTAMLSAQTVRSQSSHQYSYLAASTMCQDNTFILEWPRWIWNWPVQHILTHL